MHLFSSIRLLTLFCSWLTAARSFSPKRSIVRFSRVKASWRGDLPSSSGRSARDVSSLFPLSPFWRGFPDAPAPPAAAAPALLCPLAARALHSRADDDLLHIAPDCAGFITSTARMESSSSSKTRCALRLSASAGYTSMILPRTENCPCLDHVFPRVAPAASSRSDQQVDRRHVAHAQGDRVSG